MGISRKQVVAAKLQGVMSTLERTPPGHKKNPVSLELAQEFNKILDVIAAEYPELKDDLPAQLSTRGFGSNMGVASVSFLDLEIICEQVLNLLALVE